MKVAGWLSSLAAGSGAIATLLSPVVQAFWGNHPVAASIVASALVTIAHFAPSPTGGK